MKTTRSKIVLIEWNDSNVSHGWIPKSQKDDNLAHCRTVGFVVSEDDDKLTVTLGESDSDNTMERLTIAKSSITSLRELRVK